MGKGENMTLGIEREKRPNRGTNSSAYSRDRKTGGKKPKRTTEHKTLADVKKQNAKQVHVQNVQTSPIFPAKNGGEYFGMLSPQKNLTDNIFDIKKGAAQVQPSEIYPVRNAAEYSQMYGAQQLAANGVNAQELPPAIESAAEQQAQKNLSVTEQNIEKKRKKLDEAIKKNDKKQIAKLKKELKTLKQKQNQQVKKLNEIKTEFKPEAKPEVKPEVKPDVKPEAKPEVKPEAKPEVKPEVKPGVKPEAKPDVKPASAEAAEAAGLKAEAKAATKTKSFWSKIGQAMKGKKGKAAIAGAVVAVGAGLVAMCSGGDKKSDEPVCPKGDKKAEPAKKPTPVDTSDSAKTDSAKAEKDSQNVLIPVDDDKAEGAGGEDKTEDAAAADKADKAAKDAKATKDAKDAKTAEAEKSGGSDSIAQNRSSLESIAKSHGVSVEELRKLNEDKVKTFKTADGGTVEGFLVGEDIKLPQRAKKLEGLKNKEEAIKEYEEALIRDFDKIPQALWNQVCTPEFRKKHHIGEYKEAA